MGVTVFAEVDLSNLENEIIEEYCDHNCLKNKVTIADELRDYITTLYKDMFVHRNPTPRDLKTVAQDLERLIR